MAVRKQSLSHEDFLRLRAAGQLVPAGYLRRKAEQAAELIRRHTAGKAAAYGWSGGKDSIALRIVCEMAGVHECVLGMSNLEYPAFLCWITDHMPERLHVINTGLDLDWLVANPRMLFPQDSETAAQWFAQVQHTAQARFWKERAMEVLVLGRRRDDGNFVGRGPEPIYTDGKGVTRLSPLADWSHRDVFALIDAHKAAMPPIYDWPRGYRCGTHAWAARQWCQGEAHGWAEVYGIDPAIVRFAAERLPGAAAFLENL